MISNKTISIENLHATNIFNNNDIHTACIEKKVDTLSQVQDDLGSTISSYPVDTIDNFS